MFERYSVDDRFIYYVIHKTNPGSKMYKMSWIIGPGDKEEFVDKENLQLTKNDFENYLKENGYYQIVDKIWEHIRSNEVPKFSEYYHEMSPNDIKEMESKFSADEYMARLAYLENFSENEETKRFCTEELKRFCTEELKRFCTEELKRLAELTAAGTGGSIKSFVRQRLNEKYPELAKKITK